MPIVLVTGASGYIGFATAQNLRRRGFHVIGLIRDAAHADKLIQNEIEPLVGDITDEKAITDQLLDSVYAIVDNVMNYSDNPPLQSNRNLVARVAESSKRSGFKKRYVYTSGCLVYGDHNGAIIDETSPLRAKVPRVAFEREFLANTDIEPVVLRPTWVYGGTGNKYLASWWKGNDKDEILIEGNPKKRWGWVHVYDLAEAYGLIVEAPKGVVSGEAFDAGDSTRATVEEVRVAYARAAGVKGDVKYAPARTDPFSQACEASGVPSAVKLQRLLGWRPRQGTVLDNVALQYRAAKAAGSV